MMGDAPDAKEHHRRYRSSQKEAGTLLGAGDHCLEQGSYHGNELGKEGRPCSLQVQHVQGQEDMGALDSAVNSWAIWTADPERAETEAETGSEAGDVVSRKPICKARMQKRERESESSENSFIHPCLS